MKQKFPKARNGLTASALIGLVMGFWTVSASAQTDCTTANWTGGVTGTVTVGTQGATNRRFAGPCGARVQANANNFLVDNTPTGETSYIARFYAFLQNLNGPAIIFAGRDDSDDLVQVWYNFPTANDITLRVFPASGGPVDLTESNVGPGWHSIELVWAGSANADIALSVNGLTDLVAPGVNTTGLTVAQAQLGILNGAEAGVTGSADFDDFDSRRTTRPGRLCRGLTVPEGTGTGQRAALALADVSAVFAEVSSFGVISAGGQPDFDRNGTVTLGDVSAIFSRVSNFQTSCELNR